MNYRTCRNPLKSGQCFLLIMSNKPVSGCIMSQSPQIGSMFPTQDKALDTLKQFYESQSPQIGSMFPTYMV